jgi:hypothetical protein
MGDGQSSGEKGVFLQTVRTGEGDWVEILAAVGATAIRDCRPGIFCQDLLQLTERAKSDA